MMPRPAPSERGVVTPGGVRLAYTVSGAATAPPLVLLHALGERGESWSTVTAALTERFRVFAFDLRGHGDSDWPGTYSLELLRDDVLGGMDELGLGNVTLLGHSLGGVVAYLMAIAQPQRIECLVVEDVTPPFPQDRPVPQRPDVALDFDWLVVPAFLGQVNIGDEAIWDSLSAITAPTLLIGGGPTSHVPPDMLEAVVARVPRCELVTIDAGHHVHVGEPEVFVRVVLSWIDGLAVRPGGG